MKLKSAVIGFSYLAGLISAFQLGISPFYSFIIFFAGTAAGFILAALKKHAFGLFLIIFAVTFGVYGLYRITTLDFADNLASQGETREVTGRVISKTAPSHDMAGYTVEAVIDGVRTRFSLYTLDTGAEPGDIITLDASFSLLRDNTAFAEASYYLSRGVFLRANAKSTPAAEKQEGFSVAGSIGDFNRYLKRQIMTAFPNDTGALICAVFLGDKSSLSPALSQNIQRAGIAHYTAVSGLHLTLLAHLFISVLNLTRLRTMRKLKFFSLTMLTLAFMIFFNMSPSVTRAGIILIIFYGGELFMRRGNTLNSVGIAALFILIPAPYAALDAGLLLSIAGTIGIGVIAPAINEHFKSLRLKKTREAFVSNLCASYATLPLVALFFGGASLVSPITSIILLPLFTVLLISMLFFAFSAGFGGLSLLIAGIMAKIIHLIANFFGGLKFAYIPLDYGFLVPWVFASVIFTALTLLLGRKIIIAARAAVISVFALAMMVISAEYLSLEQTRLEIFSDGTSACVFLRNKNNSVAIITDDGIRTAYAAQDFINSSFLDEVGLLIVLNSTNNSLRYFREIPAAVFISPTDEQPDGFFDVGGVFNVKRAGNSAFITYEDITVSVTHVKSSSNSDINITYAYSVNAGDFGGLIINTARRQEVLRPDELNAFYTPVKLKLN